MIELNRVYNEDCLYGLRKMGAGSVDLVVTSPPYDNLRSYGNEVDKKWGEHVWKLVVTELYRVVKDGGVVVWVVGDATIGGSETGTSFRQALWFMDVGFRLHDTMIYYKDNPCPVGGKNRYYQAFEYMFVFSKGAPLVFNPLTEPRRNKYNDRRTERYKGFQRNVEGELTPKLVKINQGDPKRRNVWRYSLGSSDHTGHPAVFPFQLAKEQILSWSNPGDIVLDPFMGSGTTAIAALREGRRFIGFEISAEYYETICNRLKDEGCLSCT